MRVEWETTYTLEVKYSKRYEHPHLSPPKKYIYDVVFKDIQKVGVGVVIKNDQGLFTAASKSLEDMGTRTNAQVLEL